MSREGRAKESGALVSIIMFVFQSLNLTLAKMISQFRNRTELTTHSLDYSLLSSHTQVVCVTFKTRFNSIFYTLSEFLPDIFHISFFVVCHIFS